MTVHHSAIQTGDQAHRLPIVALGLSLSAFFSITYGLCVALRVFVPDVGNHLPWFQFLPGFDWTPTGILLGLFESIAYGWYVALVYGFLFNWFSSQRG